MAKTTRPRLRAWEIHSDEWQPTPVRPHHVRERQFRRLVALYLPQTFVYPSGVDIQGFVTATNEVISTRGLVTFDGDVLTMPLNEVVTQPGIIQPEVVHLDENLIAGTIGGFKVSRPIPAGPHTEVIYEYHPDGHYIFPVSPPRAWGEQQRTFFGLADPYQMGEDSTEYSWTHMMVDIVHPYLSSEEKIVALLDGLEDRYTFSCTCHSAEVVYTTRARLVCMACGATHLVLKKPIPIKPKRSLNAMEWRDYFDEFGPLRDEEVELAVLDFNLVEDAEKIWVTTPWEEAAHEFRFFARSSPEDIEAAIRGTERDASVFLEAGWSPMELPPPPAEQVAKDSVDVDLIENAGLALEDGVSAFLRARTTPSHLVHAIPQLFRAIELLLKGRLVEDEPNALNKNPSNPAVLRLLASHGVNLTADELDAIGSLRKLRNQLQHGTAAFNYRTAMTVARKAIVFVDHFTLDELGLWIGDAVARDSWLPVLGITEVMANARVIAAARTAIGRESPTAEISMCSYCETMTVLRPHQNSGAFCLCCRQPPYLLSE